MKCSKILKVISLALILSVSLTSCGAGSKQWKEEVQLSDGRVIVVERESVYESGGDEWASNRSGKKIKSYILRFPNLDGSGKLILWETVKIDPFTYPEIPLVLDTEAEHLVMYSLVAISAGCDVYSKYVYQNGLWTEEKLPERFKQHATNLLFGSKKDAPSLINFQEKYNRNNELGYRKALKQVGPNLKVCG